MSRTDELAKGINLAAEFPDNPFSEPFKKVEDAVRTQQEYETLGIRNILSGFGAWTWIPHKDDAPQVERQDRLVEKARALEAAARAAVKPVKHSLKIVPMPES